MRLRSLESVAVGLGRYRRTLFALILASVAALVAFSVFADRLLPSINAQLPTLIILSAIFLWSLAGWLFHDAFSPDLGWLRSDGRLSFYFPWARWLLVMIILLMVAAPALPIVLAYA